MRVLTFLTFLAFLGGAAGVQKTSRDKVYSKAQAERGSQTYAKVCAACHDPAKLDPKKEKGPELVGEKFLAEWSGKQLSEILEITLLTMPNDGSAVLTEEQTADVIAYILQANGQPDGAAELKYAAGKDIVIAK